jgi:hypothetical protein
VTAADLCFDAVAHFPPYLYSVPSAITPHQPLLRALGVRDTFTQSDYVVVLRRLYTDAAGEPLTAQQLALALQLLDHVVDLLPEGTYSPPHSTAFEVTDFLFRRAVLCCVFFRRAATTVSWHRDLSHTHPARPSQLSRHVGVAS